MKVKNSKPINALVARLVESIDKLARDTPIVILQLGVDNSVFFNFLDSLAGYKVASSKFHDSGVKPARLTKVLGDLYLDSEISFNEIKSLDSLVEALLAESKNSTHKSRIVPGTGYQISTGPLSNQAEILAILNNIDELLD